MTDALKCLNEIFAVGKTFDFVYTGEPVMIGGVLITCVEDIQKIKTKLSTDPSDMRKSEQEFARWYTSSPKT